MKYWENAKYTKTGIITNKNHLLEIRALKFIINLFKSHGGETLHRLEPRPIRNPGFTASCAFSPTQTHTITSNDF